MPDSAVPVVRRPVRRVPSTASKESPELRRLSVGEVTSSNSRGSSAEKDGTAGNGTAVGPRVLLRRSIKVKTVGPAKEESALQRIMRDDDLPPPFPVSPVSTTDPPPASANNSCLTTRASPAQTKSRRRVAKTCVSLSFLSPNSLLQNFQQRCLKKKVMWSTGPLVQAKKVRRRWLLQPWLALRSPCISVVNARISPG